MTDINGAIEQLGNTVRTINDKVNSERERVKNHKSQIIEKLREVIEKLKELGITNPSPELLEYFLTNSETNFETNLQREYKSMNPQRKKGGVIPFYIGKIGN